jgi:RNA-dependent RNA polymerase
MRLAKLCSQAVDYAKNGNPVDIHNNKLPKPLIKFKPDWHKAEVTGARELDYYVSERALGYMFRNVNLLDPDKPVEGLPAICPEASAPLEDRVSCVLAPLIQRALNLDTDVDRAELGAESKNGHAERLHANYTREMRYICVTHTLVDQPDVRLKEEEVVLGTILANCVQSRWRNDRTYRMRLHTEGLVNHIRARVVQSDDSGTLTEEQLRSGLSRAWEMWSWAQHHRDREFIDSFSLIVLGLMFDFLKRLGGLPQV